MGIFDALNTAVASLQSQSYALQNISGNIANASTIGYKGIDTSFEDLVAQASSPTAQVAGGVTALSQQTLTTSGTVTSSTVATNMAINGDGFFSVQKPTSIVDNEPVFNGVTDYTRAGDFQVNANGNLVNGAGYYLMGVTVDPKTGRRLLFDGRHGRSEDRKPARQRAAGPAVSEQLRAGTADQQYSIRRQPADHTEDHRKHHRNPRHAGR